MAFLALVVLCEMSDAMNSVTLKQITMTLVD